MFGNNKNEELLALQKELQEHKDLISKYKSALQTLKIKYDNLLKNEPLKQEAISLTDKELKQEFKNLRDSNLSKKDKDILRKILLVVEAENDKYFYDYFKSKFLTKTK